MERRSIGFGRHAQPSPHPVIRYIHHPHHLELPRAPAPGDPPGAGDTGPGGELSGAAPSGAGPTRRHHRPAQSPPRRRPGRLWRGERRAAARPLQRLRHRRRCLNQQSWPRQPPTPPAHRPQRTPAAAVAGEADVAVRLPRGTPQLPLPVSKARPQTLYDPLLPLPPVAGAAVDAVADRRAIPSPVLTLGRPSLHRDTLVAARRRRPALRARRRSTGRRPPVSRRARAPSLSEAVAGDAAAPPGRVTPVRSRNRSRRSCSACSSHVCSGSWRRTPSGRSARRPSLRW